MDTRHDTIEEAIAAYVLDAIEPDERHLTLDEVLDHVAGCATCRATFRDLREVAGDLALAATPARVPEALEQRIMAQVRGEAPVTALRQRRRPWPVRAFGVAAAAAVLALGAINIQVVSNLRDERARARETTRALAILSDPSAARASLTSTAGGGTLSLAVRKDGSAILVGFGLPDVPSERVLQLWVMRRGEPVPAGVFVPDDGATLLSLRIAPGAYDAAAVTIEPGPRGSARPTTDVIFSGSLRV